MATIVFCSGDCSGDCVATVWRLCGDCEFPRNICSCASSVEFHTYPICIHRTLPGPQLFFFCTLCEASGKLIISIASGKREEEEEDEVQYQDEDADEDQARDLSRTKFRPTDVTGPCARMPLPRACQRYGSAHELPECSLDTRGPNPPGLYV